MGKSSGGQTIGYHYRLGLHTGVTRGPIDALLEFGAADKVAWTGELTASGRLNINAPQLFGGESDQGGIVGAIDFMFGEADQVPNPYLVDTFGDQTAAWRGLFTVAFAGPRYGAMNPMPQKPYYVFRKILQGWDSGECWYAEKAPVLLSGTAPEEQEFLCELNVEGSEGPGYLMDEVTDTSQIIGPHELRAAMEIRLSEPWPDGPNLPRRVIVSTEEGALVWDSGWIGDAGYHSALLDVLAAHDKSDLAGPITAASSARKVVHFAETPDKLLVRHLGADTEGDGDPIRILVQFYTPLVVDGRLWGMNAAHALVYSRTDSEKGRESFDNIDEDNLKAAADRLYAEGWGICWTYNPETDTPDSFEEKVCRIIAGSFERSITDGKWRLQLARADYDLESLAVLGEDAGVIMDFKELPITLDSAVNCLGVQYFDVEAKESRVVWARAPGLARTFGEIKEILDYDWIPTGSLAARVAERELRDRITPRRSFEVVTDPGFRDIVRNQTVRFRAPSRGIAELVCIVGDRELGTLRSGAIRWKLSQHVYSFGDAQYVETEPGVDTRPPQVPDPVDAGLVLEAPYTVLSAALSRADLQALPDDVGYLVASAAAPAAGLDFNAAIQADGGDYEIGPKGHWSPTAVVAGIYPAEVGPTVVSLASGSRLGAIETGMAVVWDGEWCRLDALDLDAMTATLARGCVDTLPATHADGSRLWFLGDEPATDATEYTDGELVHIKLLTNTGSRQLALDVAAALPLLFDGRQARPYPPAGLQINGADAPAAVVGEIALTWKHRDRVLQSDQLIDQAMESIGPEPGTTYTVRCYVADVLDSTQTGLTEGAATVSPSGDGAVRVEVESVNSGLTSWQVAARSFHWALVHSNRTTEAGDRRVTEAGEPRITE